MARRRQEGFTYVVVMFVVAIAAVVATRAVQNAYTDERRAREAELIHVGLTIRQAIMNYYEYSPGTQKEFPESLEALLVDKRLSTLRRPLRRLYRDPVTGDAQWGLVQTEDGRVQGVYSLSGKVPLKKGGFVAELAHFAGASSYQEWRFIYTPN